MRSPVPRETDNTWLGLQDRVCVVTGAGGGIGGEVARQLLSVGARVALLDLDAQRCAHAVADLHVSTERFLSLSCDVQREDSVQDAAKAVAQAWGPADVLVNNAAMLHTGALMDLPLAQWNQCLAVNLSGYLLCAQVFGRAMRVRGTGAMVHVASIAASVPQPYSGAYSVSKAGVTMLSRLLAVELGASGIRSNVVSPALVRTPMSEGIYTQDAVRAQREKLVPAGRISTVADVAQTVLFLASDKSAYLNGQEILVDGGLTQTWLTLIPRPGFEKEDVQAQRNVA